MVEWRNISAQDKILLKRLVSGDQESLIGCILSLFLPRVTLLFSFGGSVGAVIIDDSTCRSNNALSSSFFFGIFIIAAVIACCVADQYFEQYLEDHHRPEQDEGIQAYFKCKDDILYKVWEPASCPWVQLEVYI